MFFLVCAPSPRLIYCNMLTKYRIATLEQNQIIGINHQQAYSTHSAKHLIIMVYHSEINMVNMKRIRAWFLGIPQHMQLEDCTYSLIVCAQSQIPGKRNFTV